MAAQTPNRIDLAREQLETAIAVLLGRRRHAATVISAAAAVVLGQAPRRNGQ